jgi:methionyl aminopeptidase
MGFHADLNETYCIGEVSESSKFLIEKTYESLEKSIAICKPGVMYRDIGNIIAKSVEEHGYNNNNNNNN